MAYVNKKGNVHQSNREQSCVLIVRCWRVEDSWRFRVENPRTQSHHSFTTQDAVQRHLQAQWASIDLNSP